MSRAGDVTAGVPAILAVGREAETSEVRRGYGCLDAEALRAWALAEPGGGGGGGNGSAANGLVASAR